MSEHPTPEPTDTIQIRELRTAAALAQLPHGADYRCNRYEDDNDFILHIWNERTGESFDIRARKPRKEANGEPTRF